jgi:spore coat protein SA
MASGVPVVASSIGGLNDIIADGINGILVPEKESFEIALAVKRLLDEKDTYQRIAENAARHVRENFSYSSRAEALVRIANGLINGIRVVSK